MADVAIGMKVSIYQRIKLASDGAPSCALTSAVGFPSTTSRLLAHFSAADLSAKVIDSRWTSPPSLMIRILAVWRMPPEGYLRVRTEISHNRQTWKTAQKQAISS